MRPITFEKTVPTATFQELWKGRRLNFRATNQMTADEPTGENRDERQVCISISGCRKLQAMGQIVFSNPSRLTLAEIEVAIRLNLIDGEYFVPSHVSLPELYSSKFNPELDHCWHEFDFVQETDEIPTDQSQRTIEDLSRALGWSFQAVRD
jgi:hypothetical protein